MKSQDKHMIEKFEKVVWLYISKELSEKEQLFWDNQIKNNPELREIINQINEVQNFYNSTEIEDIEDELFDKAISNAVIKGRSFSLRNLLRKIAYGSSDEINPSYKLAFGSLMVIAAVVIFLFSNNPNPVKDIGNELFAWENEKISSSISEIDDELYLMNNREIRNNLKVRISNDPWDNEIHTIKKQIDQLELEISNTNL